MANASFVTHSETSKSIDRLKETRKVGKTNLTDAKRAGSALGLRLRSLIPHNRRLHVKPG